MDLISVNNALEIVLANTLHLKNEQIILADALSRVLAEDILADRDFPPFHRVTMDGIAINFESYIKGNRTFNIQNTQVAGDIQGKLADKNACIEVMTGSPLPLGTDTVIRYEDLKIIEKKVDIFEDINKSQNVHFQGYDCLKDTLLLHTGTQITASHLAILATVGKSHVMVKANPKVAIISSGDELVPVNEIPLAHQIRTSNVYAIAGLLENHKIVPTHLHIADDLAQTTLAIKKALANFDVLILSGGVSMGKKDFIPQALHLNGVEKLFHKIAQKPGKPMWFGRTDTNVVFALPGNPVSTFMCTVKYVIPWLEASLGVFSKINFQAFLSEQITFKPNLTYFLQVKTSNVAGKIMATPIKHNGSGDFIGLADANGFIEIPQSTDEIYAKDSLFNIYLF
jgi:molybdopterin molybdotransferase